MIDGKMLRDALISGANNISKHRTQVDALNVFPVPDGDTGTNMSMTCSAAKRELELLDDKATIAEVSNTAASAMLRGARGNSGVILSLLFRGMAKGFHGEKELTPETLVKALELGVEAAYNAVMKPTEGTILTVARKGAEAAKATLEEQPDLEIVFLWDIIMEATNEALEKTPEQLPVLKKAGVVDAGGRGLEVIYQGMTEVFHGNGMVPADAEEAVVFEDAIEHDAAAEFEGEITFTYCTEFIVLKAKNEGSGLSLRAYLESLGDSVVVVEDDDIIKCHLHTDNPGDAMQRALTIGQLTSIKVDNMRQQHEKKKSSAKSAQRAQAPTQKFEYVPVDPDREYGFVAVGAGDGIHALFSDLMVDNVVSGGQTMNPSTDDILEAIQATPAKTVIVLPNNKNIIMAAEQAGKLADRKVYVLPTTSIPQGLTAMLSFDPDATLSENQLNMVEATKHVDSGLITFAARDSDIDGMDIHKDEMLCLENGKVTFSDKDLKSAMLRMIRSLVSRDSSYVTLIYGEDISDEQAEEIAEAVEKRLPDGVELALVNGGQPVYFFIISVE